MRLLFATHLPFLLGCWVIFVVVVLLLTLGIDLRVTITRSVWDPAVSLVRWPALGYGLYLVNALLPVCVAHGRTRREFLSYWAMLLVWTTIGLLAAAAFYRASGFELPAIALALVMVVVTGYAPASTACPSSAPWSTWPTSRWSGLRPVPGRPALGAAVTWALVRDIPIRTA